MKCSKNAKDNRNQIMTTSSIRTKSEMTYIPGGTASIINGKWSSRFCNAINDSTGMGRWSGMIIRVDDYTFRHYYTFYQVCNQMVKKTNSLSTYTQQIMYILASGNIDPNTRKKLFEDLLSQINEIPPTNYIVIGIDANEALKENNSEIQKFIEESNLVDTYHILQHNIEVPTHFNGSSKIDFILCSKNLGQYITQVGVLKFYDGFQSNHRGIFCDISEKLFTNTVDGNIFRTQQIGTNSNKEGENAYGIWMNYCGIIDCMEKYKN
jgi:hypothetical protein